MPRHRGVVAPLTAVLIALLVSSTPVGADDRAATVLSSMPIVSEHHYRMLARVRPLLFWISRDNVGGARIRRREDGAGGRGFELLIGSDPNRAPRRVNRWGYIAEEARGSSSTTLGVMKQSKEESFEDAKAQLRLESDGQYVFKAIRATAAHGQATSSVSTISAPYDFTYRELDPLLNMLDTASRGTVKTVALPVGTRPGFLLALADLIDNPDLKSVPYAYNGRFHQLTRKGTASVAMRVKGRDVTTLRAARFETEDRTTHERTAFDITYGTLGDLAGVPVHIMYQPRWWIQVELFLEPQKGKL
jgi:hypothetical protein